MNILNKSWISYLFVSWRLQALAIGERECCQLS